MKKYSMSEIMRTANSFTKTLNRSEALRRARAVAKIDNQIAYLELADRFTRTECETYNSLVAERRALNNVRPAVRGPRSRPRRPSSSAVGARITVLTLWLNPARYTL